MTVQDRHAVVTAGGRIDTDFALGFLHAQEDPFLIAADSGLVFLAEHGFEPDLIVGDFDSSPDGFVQAYACAHPDCEVQAWDWEKDYTDTELAAMAAVDRGFLTIDLIGATGTRLDHVIGSVQLLGALLDRGAEGRILDPCNRITMHREPFKIRRDDQWGKYVSFFAWGGEVRGVTLEGFHFPMTDGVIGSFRTLTVSNQIDAEEGSVSFRSGSLVMIEAKDGA